MTDRTRPPNLTTAPRPHRRRPSRPDVPRSRRPVLATADSAHAPRFRMILGALIGVAIGAIGADALLVAGRGRPAAVPAGRPWKPCDHLARRRRRRQIADHVAPSYRQPSGDQLVGVTGGPLKVAGLARPAAARGSRSPARDASSIGIVSGKTALYSLCGLGSRCSINRGKPSVAALPAAAPRGARAGALLVPFPRREQRRGADAAGARSAPARTPCSSGASEFSKALDHPIDQVLPSPPPSLNGLSDSAQGRLMSQADRAERVPLLLRAGAGPQRLPRAPEARHGRQAVVHLAAQLVGFALHLVVFARDDQRLTPPRRPRWHAPRRGWTASASTRARSIFDGCACWSFRGSSGCRGSGASTATRPGR